MPKKRMTEEDSVQVRRALNALVTLYRKYGISEEMRFWCETADGTVYRMELCETGTTFPLSAEPCVPEIQEPQKYRHGLN